MGRGFLVISRKTCEGIQIGEDIVVLISDIREGKVDVAIKAPRELPIRRLPRFGEGESDGTGHSDRRRHSESRTMGQ